MRRTGHKVAHVDGAEQRDRPDIGAEARRIRISLTVAGVVLLAGVAAVGVLAGGRPVGPRHGSYVAGSADPVAAAVPPLESFVEATRGLHFSKPVPVKIVDSATLTRLATVSALPAQTAATDRRATVRALGFEPPTGAPVPAGTSDGADAFYAFTDHTIYLRRRPADAYLRALLVRELTHAIDDQHFGLRSLTQQAAGNGDHLLALDALIEGDATTVERAYAATQSAADRKTIAGAAAATTTYPTNRRGFVQNAGADFVTALLATNGTTAINDAFGNPPISTAQILAPEEYAGDQQPTTVREPSSAGAVIDRGSLGEFGLAMLLTHGRRYQNAGRLTHWQGDTYVTTKAGRRTCVTDTVLITGEVARDQLATDLHRAIGVPVPTADLDNSLTFQLCR